ncbi:MAG: signal peptide peptidase SppA [Deltaproteobacteria bacterium]|nr:signal peptide peptidase SppA [Deltaproteobacteria bacterium]
MTLVALLASPGFAQSPQVHHPVVPSASVAAEDGPGALWVNPANLAYDPDLRYGAFFDATSDQSRVDLGATIGTGAFGFGLHNSLRDEAALSDWSLDYATAVALPERLAVGLLLSWNFIDGGDNYVAYDAGLSWRPLPWLGVSGVAQNVGNPDPNSLALPRTAAGIALRPLGRGVVLGVDYARLFEPQSEVVPASFRADQLLATLRVRPAEGLYLRGNINTSVDEAGVEVVSAGAGIEIYFDGIGAGVHETLSAATEWELAPVASDPALPGRSAWIGTDEPGESLVRSGRQVPVLALDRTPPYQRTVSLFLADEGPTWLEILERLRRLESDRGVRGLVLQIDDPNLSWGQAAELRERILALEQGGKQVLVYLSGNPGNVACYIASAASRVALHPAANLSLVGLSVEMQYLRGLLDLVGVEPQVVRRAEYKAAPEQLTRFEPSEPALEQMDALLDDTFDELVAAIGRGRDVDAEKVREWIDGGPHTAAAALEAGLVDVLLYPDEIDRDLAGLHGGSVSAEDLNESPQPHSPWEDPSQIAIVYVEGAIVSGEGSPGGLLSGRVSGSKSTVRALERAAGDGQVKAVVLRVDSPGGSSFASDEIWRAVERVQEAGKPVVASMGGVAASGGYYVAAGSDAIWAEPATITDSIGVYSTKMSLGELLDKVGVGTTTLSRGRMATLDSPTEPWDDIQRAKMQELVDETYGQFKQRVADGRGLEPDEVENVARGRVWSGKRASENGLVDHLGGFQDAIADARARAGIPASREVALVEYTEREGFFAALAPSLVRSFAGSVGLGREDTVRARARALLAPLGTALVWAAYPEERTWLMEPWTTHVGPH